MSNSAVAAAISDGSARRAAMNSSSWAVANSTSREFLPLSQVPLDRSYLKFKSERQGERISRATASVGNSTSRSGADPASIFVNRKYVGEPEPSNVPDWARTNGTHIVFGSDATEIRPMSQEFGSSMRKTVEPVDLTRSIEPIRDATLDGAHPASLQESHFLSVHQPFDSNNRVAAASFKSAEQLKEANRRHTRSAYHPEQKFKLPPTEQNEIGWQISDKYGEACAKYSQGAAWHARQGSHITKFSERLLLGARHHVSGPLASKKLYY